jgi:hypothetical protein
VRRRHPAEVPLASAASSNTRASRMRPDIAYFMAGVIDGIGAANPPQVPLDPPIAGIRPSAMRSEYTRGLEGRAIRMRAAVKGTCLCASGSGAFLPTRCYWSGAGATPSHRACRGASRSVTNGSWRTSAGCSSGSAWAGSQVLPVTGDRTTSPLPNGGGELSHLDRKGPALVSASLGRPESLPPSCRIFAGNG